MRCSTKTHVWLNLFYKKPDLSNTGARVKWDNNEWKIILLKQKKKINKEHDYWLNRLNEWKPTTISSSINNTTKIIQLAIEAQSIKIITMPCFFLIVCRCCVLWPGMGMTGEINRTDRPNLRSIHSRGYCCLICFILYGAVFFFLHARCVYLLWWWIRASVAPCGFCAQLYIQQQQ